MKRNLYFILVLAAAVSATGCASYEDMTAQLSAQQAQLIKAFSEFEDGRAEEARHNADALKEIAEKAISMATEAEKPEQYGLTLNCAKGVKAQAAIEAGKTTNVLGCY